MSTTDSTVPPSSTAPPSTAAPPPSLAGAASGAPAPPAPPGRDNAALWQLCRRVHFYAGVLVAPFLVVACLTGLAYVFSPQLSDAVYAEQLRTAPTGAPAVPLDAQVAAARAAHPEGTVSSVLAPGVPDRTTAVVLSVPELTDDWERSVYVDPYSGQVRGALDTWFDYPPLQSTLDALHRNLLLGEVGRVYSELAASWLWVLVVGGLALWFGRVVRGRRVAGQVLPPRRYGPGRRRVQGWHGAVGVWLAVALLFISATGLTWSHCAGDRFTALVTALDGRTPQLAKQPVEVRQTPPLGVQAAIDVARTEGLVGPLKVRVPASAEAAYHVEEASDSWPVQRDKLSVDPYTGAVTEKLLFQDFPLMSRLTSFGVLAHMGLLFGLPNQLALATMAVGLLCMIFWGYRMWWQRRPTKGGRPAPLARRGALRSTSQPVLFGVVLAALLLSWVMPVLGASLVGFLVLDAVLARRRAPAQG